MKKLTFMILLSLTACQPINHTFDDTGTDDAISVHDFYWALYDNVKPYPFTTNGPNARK